MIDLVVVLAALDHLGFDKQKAAEVDGDRAAPDDLLIQRQLLFRVGVVHEPTCALYALALVDVFEAAVPH